MRKLKFLGMIAAIWALMAMGVMAGCSSGNSGSSAAQDSNLAPLQKIIQSNSLEQLAGANGTLECTYEAYDGDGNQEESMRIQWATKDTLPSIKYTDTIDGSTQLTESAYANDNNGALYSLEEDAKTVSIFPQNDFSSILTDEWGSLIEYEGTQGEVQTNGNVSTLEVTSPTEEGADTYFKVVYTFDTNSYRLQSVEMTDYYTEDNAVADRELVKDISTDATLDLGAQPYQQIAEGSAETTCTLTVVVTQPDSTKITSQYKVARDSSAELMIYDDFTMFSDEAMTQAIEEIDVNAESATVYVQVRETAEEDTASSSEATSSEATEGATLDLSDESVEGAEIVGEDGTVYTLGADGKFYDEEGNEADVDLSSITTKETTKSEGQQ